jgi:Ca-activated chloride channel family protein
MGAGPFRLDDPLYLALLALLISAWLLRGSARARGGAALTMPSLRTLQGARPSPRQRARWLLPVIEAAIGLMLVVALARPRIATASARVPGRGIDIVLCLDVSESMVEPGLSAPTKLQGAQEVYSDFLRQRVNDRVGLIAFGDKSIVLSPLTLDYTALEQQIESVTVGQDEDPLTTGAAIADAVNLLRSSSAKSKVIILATNEEISGNEGVLDPDVASKLAASLHVKLYTIGMFAQGETPQTTEIEEPRMTMWAETTGGFYGRAQSQADLRRIFDTIGHLETSPVERLHYTSFRELAGFLLLPAFGLHAFDLALRFTLFRQTP